MFHAIIYGDLLMCLYNQVKPYEITKNNSDDLLDEAVEYLKILLIVKIFKSGQGFKGSN